MSGERLDDALREFRDAYSEFRKGIEKVARVDLAWRKLAEETGFLKLGSASTGTAPEEQIKAEVGSDTCEEPVRYGDLDELMQETKEFTDPEVEEIKPRAGYDCAAPGFSHKLNEIIDAVNRHNREINVALANAAENTRRLEKVIAHIEFRKLQRVFD